MDLPSRRELGCDRADCRPSVRGHEQIQKAQAMEEENESYVVFIPRKDWTKPFVIEAKQKELENFQRYGAYKTITDEGQPRLTSGWVITEKLYGDVVGCKARLVVHGNQEEYDVRSDSPTVTKQTLRLVFALAAQYGWEVITSDVTSAFLQSDKLDDDAGLKCIRLSKVN